MPNICIDCTLKNLDGNGVNLDSEETQYLVRSFALTKLLETFSWKTKGIKLKGMVFSCESIHCIFQKLTTAEVKCKYAIFFIVKLAYKVGKLCLICI